MQHVVYLPFRGSALLFGAVRSQGCGEPKKEARCIRVLMCVVLLLFVPAPAFAHTDRYWELQRTAKRCSNSRVDACIERAIVQYRLSQNDAQWMWRVSSCESGRDPYQQNGSSGSTGLFQFLPSTWATTPYGRYSIFSAKWQALAAAWMIIHGRRGEWVCK